MHLDGAGPGSLRCNWPVKPIVDGLVLAYAQGPSISSYSLSADRGHLRRCGGADEISLTRLADPLC